MGTCAFTDPWGLARLYPACLMPMSLWSRMSRLRLKGPGHAPGSSYCGRAVVRLGTTFFKHLSVFLLNGSHDPIHQPDVSLGETESSRQQGPLSQGCWDCKEYFRPLRAGEHYTDIKLGL